MEHRVIVSGDRIETARLVLRPWRVSDAPAALEIYGAEDVTRWLSPAVDRVADVAQMEEVLARWSTDELEPPQRRWAAELGADGTLVGSATLRALPPGHEDLEVGWQLAPSQWGQGFATEAAHAVAHYAFDSGAEEIFSVVRPRNTRGVATARRIGMEWVGETDKYYDLRLQVYRLRKADLDLAEIGVRR